MELSKIPGLPEALAKAQAEIDARRERAFLFDTAELQIADRVLEIRHLTARDLVFFFRARNPFFCGGVRLPEHVLQFLWTLSPRFIAGDLTARDAFIEEHAELKFLPAVEAIDAFLDETFADAPGGSSRRGLLGTAPVASFFAELVHRFIKPPYQWPEETTLGKPLVRIYQYLRLLDRDANPRAPVISPPLDRIKREFVMNYRAQQKALPEAKTGPQNAAAAGSSTSQGKGRK
jgi:hypothetical protein